MINLIVSINMIFSNVGSHYITIKAEDSSLKAAKEYCNDNKVEMIEMGMIEGTKKTIRFNCIK